ncbi:MAG: hypothetical protein ABIL47_07005 [candidate division WOR-3 bacterium]
MEKLTKNELSYVNIEDNYYALIGALKDNVDNLLKIYERQEKMLDEITKKIVELEKEKNKTFEQIFWED